jgi:hypothetical protein
MTRRKPMRRRLNAYTAYSIGCFLVWALIFAIGATQPRIPGYPVVLVFLGWTIGWLSATIARYVYPSTKRRRPSMKGPTDSSSHTSQPTNS